MEQVELGRITSVIPDTEERRIYVSVRVSPDEYYDRIPFATPIKGLWMMPEQGDVVEVYNSDLEPLARVPHNPSGVTMPSMAEGSFCLRLNEKTEIFFDKQADDTFHITLRADGDLTVQTDTGALSVDSINGNVSVTAQNGNVDIDAPNGDVTIEGIDFNTHVHDYDDDTIEDTSDGTGTTTTTTRTSQGPANPSA